MSIFVKVGTFLVESPLVMKNCRFDLAGPAQAIKTLVDLVNQS